MEFSRAELSMETLQSSLWGRCVQTFSSASSFESLLSTNQIQGNCWGFIPGRCSVWAARRGALLRQSIGLQAAAGTGAWGKQEFCHYQLSGSAWGGDSSQLLKTRGQTQHGDALFHTAGPVLFCSPDREWCLACRSPCAVLPGFLGTFLRQGFNPESASDSDAMASAEAEREGGYTGPVASWGEEMAVNKNISIWPNEATTLSRKLTAGKSRVDSSV